MGNQNERRKFYLAGGAAPPPSSFPIPDQRDGLVGVKFPLPNNGSFGDQIDSFKNELMGPSTSPDPGAPPRAPAALPGTTLVINLDMRSQGPTDLPLVNTTKMEAPLRRMINPDDTWMGLETAPPPPVSSGPDHQSGDGVHRPAAYAA